MNKTQRYFDENKASFIHDLAQFEGIKTSVPEIECILNNKFPAKMDEMDLRTIINIDNALRKVLNRE